MAQGAPAPVEGSAPLLLAEKVANFQQPGPERGCHVRGVIPGGEGPVLMTLLPPPHSRPPLGAGTLAALPLWASWDGDRVLLPGVRRKLAETPETAPTPVGTAVTMGPSKGPGRPSLGDGAQATG